MTNSEEFPVDELLSGVKEYRKTMGPENNGIDFQEIEKICLEMQKDKNSKFIKTFLSSVKAVN